MDTTVAGIIVVVFIAAMGAVAGWHDGRKGLVSDCERIGSFYVGDKTFECKLKTN